MHLAVPVCTKHSKVKQRNNNNHKEKLTETNFDRRRLYLSMEQFVRHPFLSPSLFLWLLPLHNFFGNFVHFVHNSARWRWQAQAFHHSHTVGWFFFRIRYYSLFSLVVLFCFIHFEPFLFGRISFGVCLCLLYYFAPHFIRLCSSSRESSLSHSRKKKKKNQKHKMARCIRKETFSPVAHIHTAQNKNRIYERRKKKYNKIMPRSIFSL